MMTSRSVQREVLTVLAGIVVVVVSLGGPAVAQDEGDAAPDLPTLLNQAAELRRSGNLIAALDVLRQASRAVKADPARGERHPDNLAVLTMAAQTLVGLERPQAALSPLKKLAALRGDPALADTPADRAAAAGVEGLLAVCLAATGDHKLAREALARARKQVEAAAAPPGAPAAVEAVVADAEVAIASAKERLGDDEAAVAEFGAVVSKHAAGLGLTHPAVAAALAGGPRIEAAAGRLPAAADMARAGLKRLDSAGSSSDVAALPLLRVITADAIVEDGYSEAEATCDRALAISGEAFGTSHPETLLDRADRAVVMFLRGRQSEAETAGEAVAAAAETLATANDGRAGAVLRSLGDFFLSLGRVDRAERLFATARDLDTRGAGENALSVTDDLLGLGRCRLSAGDAAAAIPILDKALEIRRSQRPAADEGVMQLIRARAEAAAVAGDISTMEPLLAEIIKARPPRRSRMDDERLAALFDAAAACYEAAGRATRGRQTREQLVGLRSEQYGGEHPHVADAWMAFAVSRQSARAWEDAIDCYRRSLAIWEKNPESGSDRPEVAAVLMPLAQCLQATDRKAEARTALERAREIWNRALGPDHEVTRAAEAMIEAVGEG